MGRRSAPVTVSPSIISSGNSSSAQSNLNRSSSVSRRISLLTPMRSPRIRSSEMNPTSGLSTRSERSAQTYPFSAWTIERDDVEAQSRTGPQWHRTLVRLDLGDAVQPEPGWPRLVRFVATRDPARMLTSTRIPRSQRSAMSGVRSPTSTATSPLPFWRRCRSPRGSVGATKCCWWSRCSADCASRSSCSFGVGTDEARERRNNGFPSRR
jgi:hypothetical protein